MSLDAFGSIREGVNLNIQRSDGMFNKKNYSIYVLKSTEMVTKQVLVYKFFSV
jgi:hypothetical protein